MITARRFRWGIFGALFAIASVAEAITLPDAHDYYGDRFHQLHEAGGGHSGALRESINSVLSDFHVSEPGKLDRIYEACPSPLQPGQTCFKRQSLSYQEAREYLFGDERFHLRVAPSGEYFIRDVYCRKVFRERANDKPGIGPGLIPNASEINTEHTWPQSHFYVSPKGFMKTDLHHLFPTDSQANSIRGNHPFGEVVESGTLPDKLDCDASRVGNLRQMRELPVTERGGVYFEPPDEHKGNVARAMLYFAVRYKMEIDRVQEFYFRRWNESDPVDDDERARNEAVYSVQYMRNPFIDYPDLVNQIEDY